MSEDTRIRIDSALAGLTGAAWFDQLEEVADEHGYYNFLGKHHSAALIEAGPKLLVTFETAETIQARDPKAEPFGFHFARHMGWSHLGIYAKQESWFRDPYVYKYIDRLIDDGFFDNFEDVLFYGSDGGGYAAAAYSVASPGARVLALRPQATLDPRITGFDPRYRSHRHFEFDGRYGYAPEMIDGADTAYIVFDPFQTLDAVHVAMFTKPHMVPLRMAAFGRNLEQALRRLGISDFLIQGAMDGTLNADQWPKLMRARRNDLPYLRNLAALMIKRGRHRMAANVCAHAIRAGHTKFFVEKLQDLQAEGHHPFTPVKIEAAE